MMARCLRRTARLGREAPLALSGVAEAPFDGHLSLHNDHRLQLQVQPLSRRLPCHATGAMYSPYYVLREAEVQGPNPLPSESVCHSWTSAAVFQRAALDFCRHGLTLSIAATLTPARALVGSPLRNPHINRLTSLEYPWCSKLPFLLETLTTV